MSVKNMLTSYEHGCKEQRSYTDTRLYKKPAAKPGSIEELQQRRAERNPMPVCACVCVRVCVCACVRVCEKNTGLIFSIRLVRALLSL